MGAVQQREPRLPAASPRQHRREVDRLQPPRPGGGHGGGKEPGKRDGGCGGREAGAQRQHGTREVAGLVGLEPAVVAAAAAGEPGGAGGGDEAVEEMVVVVLVVPPGSQRVAARA